MLRKVKVIKSWRYSRHGFDSNFAAVGERLEVSEGLAESGISTGNVEYTDKKAVAKADAKANDAAAKAMAAVENKMAKPVDNKGA